MPLTDAQRLRQMLGESVRSGQTAADTLFSDDEIADFMLRGGVVVSTGQPDLDRAAYYGWVAKSAELVNHTDIQEGTSREMLSKLHLAALDEVKRYGVITGLQPGVSRNVRIGKVVRK